MSVCEWRGGKTFRQRRPCKCSLQTTAAGSNNNKSKPPLKVRSALSPSLSLLIVFVFLPAVFNCIPFCMLSGVHVCLCVCIFAPVLVLFLYFSAYFCSKQATTKTSMAGRTKKTRSCFCFCCSFTHCSCRTCSLTLYLRSLAVARLLAHTCTQLPRCPFLRFVKSQRSQHTQATLASLSRTCANESGAPLISCIDCTKREREFRCAPFVAWAESTSALLVGCALRRSACVEKRCR